MATYFLTRRGEDLVTTGDLSELPPGEADILVYLETKGRTSSPHEIGYELKLPGTKATRLLVQLQKRGLVESSSEREPQLESTEYMESREWKFSPANPLSLFN